MAKTEQKKASRGMPFSAEAEAAVLGSVLLDNGVANEVLHRLEADDFYIEQNRTIFEAMSSLAGRGRVIDTVTLADQLELDGKLDEVGSVAYIGSLTDDLLSVANSAHYVDILKRDGLIRKVIRAGNDIVKYAYDCTDGKAALDAAEKLVYDISESNSERALVKADDAFARALNSIQEAQLGNVPQNVIKTGFKTLDKRTKGLKPGEIILIAARPSVGKTAFALNIAVNVATEEKKTVAIFSLEMQDELLAKRMLAYKSAIPFEDMDAVGGLGQDGTKSNRLMQAFRQLVSASIYIDDYSLNTPADVLSKCRRLKRSKGLDLVIVDYLQLMSNSTRSSDSRQNEVSDMSRKMKLFAKELDCPIILLSQMSRDVEKREDHTPMLSDLRESGAIEQDADVVMFLHNPAKYNSALPADEIVLSLQKNRNGPIGDIKLHWSGKTTSFVEADEYRAEPTSAPAPVTVIEDGQKIGEGLKLVAADAMPFDETPAKNDGDLDF